MRPLHEENCLRIAITGSTGMVGTALSAAFRTDGHDVVPVTRGSAPGGLHWDPDQGVIDAAGLEGLDAVVHLAGANLAGGRWTAARKQQLWHSRTDGTTLLCETLAHARRPPKVLISATAVGYYGDRDDEILNEASPPGSDFLARLCLAWEAAAHPARAAAIRVVHPRFGIILSPHGSALDRMVLPFQFGLGGRYGAGTQWLSWIAIDDVIGGIRHLLDVDSATGPVNFVAPETVTNATFAATLGHVLHRPSALAVPAWALRLAVGRELADSALLASQRASGELLGTLGYRCRFQTLEAALAHVILRKRH